MSDDERAVREVIEAWTEGMRTGDVLTILKRHGDGGWLIFRDADLVGPERPAPPQPV